MVRGMHPVRPHRTGVDRGAAARRRAVVVGVLVVALLLAVPAIAFGRPDASADGRLGNAVIVLLAALVGLGPMGLAALAARRLTPRGDTHRDER